ncbi:MAG: ribonucleoside-diphosphate reductase subunit alpha [Blastocatellia bacterium]|nr:ribonucleoside-diphosphate reductase subunit alpha [Blastocatellia bacterium]
MISLDIDYSAKPISVTTGHPFYAISDSWARQVSTKTSKIYVEEGRLSVGWLEAGKLQKGDYIGQVIPTEVIVVDGFTEDDARMYGILLSCGHMDKESLESGITSSSERTVSFVRSYLDAENISYQERSEGRVSHLQWNCASSTGSAKLRFSYEDIYNKEGKKHISRRLAHLPRPQAFILLRTILVANSSLLHSREAAFHSDSLFLVESLRYQALRFGIPAKVKKNTYSYELLIPAVREIAEIMGCNELKNRNWFEWQGFIFLRLVKIKPVKASASVVDLKVEGDESYMTTSGLAHNGGKRRGACCVYLEPWHADIEEFLELKNNTGDENRRTYNLNLANWIPDVFMRRVESDGLWSLFDPKDVPNFPDLYGKEFEDAYVEAERAGIAIKQVKARDLYAKMMKTLAETGNGWMNFKDSCNSKSNQTGQSHNVIHLSNLCTEIVEVTSLGETAVCNLGSVNLSRHIVDGKLDYELLGKTVRTAIKFLDRVIDINYYPTKEAGISNQRWRPVGLGVMGLQDVFFQLRIAFDSPEAREISKKVQEEIYYNALATSSELAEKLGAHPSFAETKAAKGILQFDLWGVVPEDKERWEPLRERIKKFGLRNSLMLAIAPTATIASIVGCYECIEPQVSNLFKRETLSGDFLQVNRYLVGELKKLGLWNEDMRNQIKMGEGSIQHIDKIPEDLKLIYRTVWEIPMRSLIDMAVDRGAFIDQSQSLNLFIESPNIGKLSSMYMYAWKQGLKTTYYLRSRPASKIAKATVPVSSQVNQSQAVACSLENPESCEACQ